MQVDGRQPNREAADDAFGDARCAAARQEADVGRRPAHVERDRVLEAGAPRDETRADDAARRPRHENRRGMRGRGVDGSDTARRQHHERLGQARLSRAIRKRAQIAGRYGSEIRVGRRCRRALVLAELRCDLVRRDDVHSGMAAP